VKSQTEARHSRGSADLIACAEPFGSRRLCRVRAQQRELRVAHRGEYCQPDASVDRRADFGVAEIDLRLLQQRLGLQDFSLGGRFVRLPLVERGLRNSGCGSTPCRDEAYVAISHRPLSVVPSSAAKQAAESKRGQHNQSIEPSRPTKAAALQSPISA
jgi:hypothetical protein